MTLYLDDQLDWLTKNGFAGDLQKIILGESDFSDMRDYENLDRYSHRLRSMTLKYLSFVDEFGIDRVGETITQGTHIHSAYPAYFEAWKLSGAPGISSHLIGEFYKSKTASLL
jgi:hypothetical protein